MCVCANEYYDKIIEANDDSYLLNKRNDETEKNKHARGKRKRNSFSRFYGEKKRLKNKSISDIFYFFVYHCN